MAVAVEAAGLSEVPTAFAAAALEDPDAPEFTTAPGPAASREKGDFDQVLVEELHLHTLRSFGSGSRSGPTNAMLQQNCPGRTLLLFTTYRGPRIAFRG